MDLERVQQNTPTTLSHPWTEDGVAVDPGTVTVGITRADGSVLVAAGTATGGTGTAARTFNLTTTHTALLDTFKVTWTSTLKGTLSSFVEIAGGFLFTIAEARALKPLDNTTVYTTAAIVEMRTTVEQAIEAELGYALVPRYKLETFTPEGGTAIWSRVPLVGNVPGTGIPLVTTVRSATISGTAVGTLADVIPDVVGFYYASGWGCVRRSVVIGFEHGAQYPPERIKQAALGEARFRLVQRNVPTDDRAVRLDTEAGSYALQQPGRGGQHFYLPETDAVVQDYSLNVGVA